MNQLLLVRAVLMLLQLAARGQLFVAVFRIVDSLAKGRIETLCFYKCVRIQFDDLCCNLMKIDYMSRLLSCDPKYFQDKASKH